MNPGCFGQCEFPCAGLSLERGERCATPQNLRYGDGWVFATCGGDRSIGTEIKKGPAGPLDSGRYFVQNVNRNPRFIKRRSSKPKLSVPRLPTIWNGAVSPPTIELPPVNT